MNVTSTVISTVLTTLLTAATSTTMPSPPSTTNSSDLDIICGNYTTESACNAAPKNEKTECTWYCTTSKGQTKEKCQCSEVVDIATLAVFLAIFSSIFCCIFCGIAGFLLRNTICRRANQNRAANNASYSSPHLHHGNHYNAFGGGREMEAAPAAPEQLPDVYLGNGGGGAGDDDHVQPQLYVPQPMYGQHQGPMGFGGVMPTQQVSGAGDYSQNVPPPPSGYVVGTPLY